MGFSWESGSAGMAVLPPTVGQPGNDFLTGRAATQAPS
jgi:hypothetical protein